MLKIKWFIYLSTVGLLCCAITPANAQSQLEVAMAPIPRVSDQPRRVTTVKEWLTQATPAASVIQITGVRLNQTQGGLNVVLETANGEAIQGSASTQQNSLIVEIPNAQLRLTEGQPFRRENPAPGIAAVDVSQTAVNTVRVVVTGVDGLPEGTIAQGQTGLVLGLAVAEAPEEEVVATGQVRSRYTVPSATTATKLDVPLRDIPQSIQVIPKQVIEDRRVVRLSEVGENVSGVQPRPSYGGLSSAGFYIRGFNQRTENLRNGFRDFGFLSPRDVANVEQVEFLKGPGSVLYGGGVLGLGGTVNTLTKKPLSEAQYGANLIIGSYNFYRPTIDLTGPLTTNRALLYRLNLAYENADTFRDFNHNETIFLAPALTWQIDPQTKFTAELEYQHDQFVSDFGFPFAREALKLPVKRFLGVPGFNDAGVEGRSITYSFEHSFSNQWRFRQGFNATNANGDIRATYFGSLGDDGQTLERFPSTSREAQENYTLQNELFGKFKTGSLSHDFLIGLELARFSYSYNFLDGTVDPINIFAPTYTARVSNFEQGSAQKYGSDNLGIYLQDLVEILPNLKLLAGGRFDLNGSFYEDSNTNQTLNEQTNSHFSPRVGFVYQPSKETSLYFSWSNSFNPQFRGTSRTNAQFKPEIGEQFEVGLKQNFFKNRLSGTLAFYQLIRQNVLTSDPIDRRFSIQTGEQRSRGIELDIGGQLLPGWNVILTYAYTDAILTKDNSIPIGDRLDNIPQNSASLWTTYEIQTGNLQGLGFGAGLVYVGDRQAELPNTFQLPSYLRTDASIFYRHNRFSVALNIKNLFNVKYLSVGGDGLFPGEPVTLLGSVSVKF